MAVVVAAGDDDDVDNRLSRCAMQDRMMTAVQRRRALMAVLPIAIIKIILQTAC